MEKVDDSKYDDANASRCVSNSYYDVTLSRLTSMASCLRLFAASLMMTLASGGVGWVPVGAVCSRQCQALHFT
jgi:hypothetical protein